MSDQPAPRRVLLASDKFRGSLTQAQVVDALSRGLRARWPDATLVPVPVADGGEGTLDAAVAAGFERVPVSVTGPTGAPVDGGYARRGDTAVLELADLCGLMRLPDGRPDPLGASSRGLGEAIRAALDAGCRTLVIGAGGSASTDGGAGMLAALGAGLFDALGAPVPDGGGALLTLARIELATVDPRLAQCQILLASDVTNPLCGPDGAAAVFAPQKGAGPDDVCSLEAGLGHFARLVSEATDADDTALPGTGAAGGVGYAARAVLGARQRPGIEIVLDLAGFAGQVEGADLVVTGEGSLDAQTLGGKAVAGVSAAAAAAGVPVVAVCGRSLLDQGQIDDLGLTRVYQLLDLEPDETVCLREAATLLSRLAEQVADDWLGGV